MDKERKKALRRKFGFAALKFFADITASFSLSGLYRAGVVLGSMAYVFASRQRRIALDSLRVAFKNKTETERKKIARDFFVFMAQSSLEMLYYLAHPHQVKENIIIEGKENLKQALAKGNGAVGLNAHLGNFPLMTMRLAQEGYEVNVIARPMRDPKAGSYLHNKREESGVRTIFSYPRKECVVNTVRALRNNEVVIIHADQNFGTGGVWVNFFGKLAATPTGVVVFALRTKAAVVPMYIVRCGLGKHRLIIMPEVELDIKESREETVLINTARFTKIIEKWVKDYPVQWGWIHRRWKSRPSKEVESKRFKIQEGEYAQV